jgi:hypothetical protein
MKLATLLISSLSLAGCAVELDAEPTTSADEQALNGDAWTMVDNNDYVAGAGASYATIAVSATTKKVFVAGLRTESSGATTWIVRGSASGTSFNLNHTFSLGGSSRATASLSDHSGNIFVAGEAIDGSGTPHWVIRRSADNGASWSNVIDRPYPGLAHVIPTSMAIDGWDLTGIFVVGQLVHPNGAIDELSQRSATGTSFVDYPGSTGGMATGMLMTGLCTGWDGTWAIATTQAGSSAWVVRESSVGNSTWDFESRQGTGVGHAAASCSRGLSNSAALVGGTYGTVWELATFNGPLPTWDVDHISTGFAHTGIKGNTVMFGRAMAVGSIGTSATSATWRTRFATDSNFAVWKDSDDFTLASGKLAVANAIAQDENGQPLAATVVYVAGDAVDASNRHHGIVRRLVLP